MFENFSLLLDLLQKFVDEIQKVFVWARANGPLNDSFFVEQLVVFLKAITSLLSKGKLEDILPCKRFT